MTGLLWSDPKHKRLPPKHLWPVCDWEPIEFLPSLTGAKRIAIDVETKDIQLRQLGPGVRRDGYIVGLAVGIDDGPKFYCPIRHQGSVNFDADMVIGWARKELAPFSGEIVGANILYDLDYLAQEGVEFGNVKRFFDVQVAEPLLNENLRTYNLDSIAKRHLGEGKREASLIQLASLSGLDPKKDLWQFPGNYVGEYAEGDVELPLRIIKIQLEKIEKEGLSEVFDMESRLIPLLLAMRRRGVRVDMDKARKLSNDYDAQVKRLTKRASELAGHPVEFTNARTFADVLHKRGMAVPTTPKSGEPSVTKEFLERHGKDEFVQLVAEGRKLAKVKGTFIDGYIFEHAVNGRVHCSFNQLRSDDDGTVSGRFSSSNPNLQNLPARDPILGPLTRSLWLPDQGEIWESLDWSQIEYRLLVHFAAKAQDLYQRGKSSYKIEGADKARQMYLDDPDTDFHKACAIMARMDPEDPFVRKRVKNVNFCTVYGGGGAKVAAQIGTTLEEAQAFLKTYNGEMPFIKQVYYMADKEAQRRGFIRTVMGRKRRFDFWEPRFGEHRDVYVNEDTARKTLGENVRLQRAWTYRALNGVLQGGAADVMKKAMVIMWESGVCRVLGAPLVTVHDELGLSRPQTKEGEEAVKEAVNIMEHCMGDSLSVPMRVDRESGLSWGEAH